MKYELENKKPETFATTWEGQYEVFNWAEYLIGVPMPIFLITTYKENGLPNACLHSWSSFSGEGGERGGYFCIMGGIQMEYGHTIKNITRDKEFCINFPNKEIWDKCYKTIENNKFELDEIVESGLTVEKAFSINAPRIKECFLNLECTLEWIKPLYEGSKCCIICGRVKHIAMDDEYFDENKKGRFGESGFIMNIHSPKNPLTGESLDDKLGFVKYK
ncbi:flavin reductase [Proteiniborus sp.]|uniref:flavin reductase family protein n=1 Tax=Proteiniborus sp. TaxID=2079015 RepID=UPI00332C5807